MISILLYAGALIFLCALVLFAFAWHGAHEFTHPARRDDPSFTPPDFNLPFQNITLRSRDGLKLAAWFIPADSARGTVVLSHGYSGDKSPDLEYAPFLRGAGYNLLFFDYRAHGDSEGKFTTLGFYERLDLLGALDWLKERGMDRVAIIGFSMGGAIALLTAAETGAIAGVITDCTYADLRDLLTYHIQKRIVAGFFARALAQLVALLAYLQTGAKIWKITPQHVIGRIAPRPLLIIHGEADDAVPVAQAHKLFEAAGEPKRLWLVPNASHRRVDDLEPVEYRRHILAFLDQVFPLPISNS